MAPRAQQVLKKCLSNDKLIQMGSLFGGINFVSRSISHLAFQSYVVNISRQQSQPWDQSLGDGAQPSVQNSGGLTEWDFFPLVFFFSCTIKFIMKMNAVFKQDWRQRLVVGLGKVRRGQGRLNQVVLWFIQLSAMLWMRKKKLNWVI